LRLDFEIRVRRRLPSCAANDIHDDDPSLSSFEFAADSRSAADTDALAGYYTTLFSFPVSRLVLRPGVKHTFDTPFRPFSRFFSLA
jgi:hypothetical protein